MKKEKIFWGVFLIVGAIFILASGLGYVQGIGVWSMIWTALFAAMLIKGIVHFNFYGIFFALAFLCIIYAEPLQITAITPWPILGAALLLSIGCTMIFPKKHKSKGNWSVTVNTDPEDGRVINETDGESISCKVSMGSSAKYINSDDFRQADLECSFGELKVYFDNAVMQGSDAVVQVKNSFGETDLYVPKTWTVDLDLNSFCGDVSEKGHPEPDGRHRLHVDGSNSFGEVCVIYI